MKKYFLISCFLLVSACSLHRNPSITQASFNLNRTPFYAIHTSGNVKVELRDGARGYELFFSNLKDKVSGNFTFRVEDGVLYLNTKEKNTEMVKVSFPNIKKLTASGNSYIKGKLHSSNLIVTANRSGSVDLNGTVNLSRVVNEGEGNIRVSWVDNDNSFLKVQNIKEGKIILAGIATKVLVNASGSSHTCLVNLKTDHVAVNSAQTSKVDLVVRRTLKIYAKERSLIRYYDPQPLTIVSKLEDEANLLHSYGFSCIGELKPLEQKTNLIDFEACTLK